MACVQDPVVYRRCGCADAVTGKRLGNRRARLANPVHVIDYIFARKVGKWIASAGKKDSVRLQYKATWVMHTYLGIGTTGDDDELLKLEVKPTADSGSTCRMTSGSSRQTSLTGWRADGDDEFLFTVQDTDGDKADKCTLRPTMVDVDDAGAQARERGSVPSGRAGAP
ncbi:hypothetical protein ACU635_34625 [[Actinomadura] parvosata]|uniref:hypothetical protein n=1 Tax=[Actinomadura] parvosata TaxID=1955412 RepID=UPI00406C739E